MSAASSSPVTVFVPNVATASPLPVNMEVDVQIPERYRFGPAAQWPLWDELLAYQLKLDLLLTGVDGNDPERADLARFGGGLLRSR